VFQIGDHKLDSPALLAPMAGISDLPFRRLCRKFGAGLTTSEMVTSDTKLWKSRKSATRLVIEAQSHPVSMQIAGSDAEQMVGAALGCKKLGADIIDINMGCPAKKVCKKLAGSALLSDEGLVNEILTEVVKAIDIPVTLKTRTGPDLSNKNAISIGRIAEKAGIKAIALHGRTRACRFNGRAEYETIRQLANEISIPVFANGDIDSAAKAKKIIDATSAKGVLIGRAALGRPWIFKEISSYLFSNDDIGEPSLEEKQEIIMSHLRDIHSFYGDFLGVRIARKHFGWYCDHLQNGKRASKFFNTLDSTEAQISCVKNISKYINI